MTPGEAVKIVVGAGGGADKSCNNDRAGAGDGGTSKFGFAVMAYGGIGGTDASNHNLDSASSDGGKGTTGFLIYFI